MNSSENRIIIGMKNTSRPGAFKNDHKKKKTIHIDGRLPCEDTFPKIPEQQWQEGFSKRKKKPGCTKAASMFRIDNLLVKHSEKN